MANHHQNQASSKSGPSSNAEPKTYTSAPRIWSQESPSSHTRLPSSTDTVNADTNYQNQHPTSHHNPNLPTPMDRWFAESLKESPFNIISIFENPPQGQGRRQSAEGGERMERGNGGSERYAGDSWSMDRNEQSERWA